MKSLKFKFFGIIGLMMFLCLFTCWGEDETQEQEPSHKRILIIHSQDQLYSAYLNITQSFTMQMCSPELDCEFEHFDVKVRTQNDEFPERFAPFIEKIKEGYYDAIACIGNMIYWHLNKEEYFDAIPENVPILYIGVDYSKLPKPHINYRNYYVYYPYDTAELALKIFPERKNIAFLSRAGWTDTKQGAGFRHSIESIPGVDIQFYDPTSYTDDELVEKLSENKEHTFAIVNDWPRQNESLQAYILGIVNMIRKLDQAGIPVFILRDYLQVDGTVGGVVTKICDVGKDAANWLKGYFLNGPDNPYVPLVYYENILDWNALNRYHVKGSNVPIDVVVVNKPYGFWDHHRFKILTIIGIVFVTLSLLLAVALVKIIKKRHQIVLQNNMLKETAEKARRAEAAKGRFLSNMSHEIRTPLSVIISLSDLLQFKDISEDEKHDNLTTIHYASESLLKLINNILDFSKLEEGKMKIKEEEILIREMLNEIDKIFQVKASEKKIGFHCEYANVPARIWLDEVHLKGIIVNLLGNSMKFTNEGKVELIASFSKENAETGVLTMRVRDTGIGMSPEFLKDLFKPFNQEGRSNAVGTGLGLTISRRMAQSMGGDLTVESEMGKGSTFTLVIPDVKYSEKTPVKESASEQFGEEVFSNYKILVVDDMQMNLMVVTKVMKNFGIKPLLADTPEKALNLLKENEVDIILTDLRMPEMNGDQLAREMRKLPNGQKAKIYVLTADAYAKEEIDMSGVDDVLVKPLSLDKIREVLKSYSSKKVA